MRSVQQNSCDLTIQSAINTFQGNERDHHQSATCLQTIQEMIIWQCGSMLHMGMIGPHRRGVHWRGVDEQEAHGRDLRGAVALEKLLQLAAGALLQHLVQHIHRPPLLNFQHTCQQLSFDTLPHCGRDEFKHSVVLLTIHWPHLQQRWVSNNQSRFPARQFAGSAFKAAACAEARSQR